MNADASNGVSASALAVVGAGAEITRPEGLLRPCLDERRDLVRAAFLLCWFAGLVSEPRGVGGEDVGK